MAKKQQPQYIDMAPEGAKEDADFVRMVQHVQDQANTGVRGWMVARGAFDRNDLLFMRQEEDKRRFAEIEQEEQERLAFMAARAKAEEEEEARRLAAIKAAAAEDAARRRREEADRKKKLIPIVKVKPAAASRPGGSSSGAPPEQPAPKKQRTEEGTAAGAGAQHAQQQEDSGGAGGEAASSGSEGGLGGLLGAYGSSDSESEDSQAAAKRGLGVLERTGALVPQGVLVKTAKLGWRTAWQTLMTELAPQSKDGQYSRPTYSFQGLLGSPEFPLELGRYHLYVGNPCPWCHRVLLALLIGGLGEFVSFSRAIDDPERASRGGWVFDEPGGDPVFGRRDLRQVYDLLSPGFSGRCTAPLLVDRRTRRAVCNESAIICANFAELARPLGGAPAAVDLRPPQLVGEIDAWNERIYDTVNNGVYKCGFSTTQAGFSQAEAQLFATLDELDALLSRQRFVCGDRFTEADLRLLPTLVRFDAVYATLFKCCKKRVADYPHLQAWLRDVHQLQLPGGGLQVADCFDLEDARRSYFGQLFPLNPGGIVPGGPTAADLGLHLPPGRGPVDFQEVFHFKAAPAS